MTRPLEEPSPFKTQFLALTSRIDAASLAGSRGLHNARWLLAAATEAPVPATKKLGNLNRRFVSEALENMRWPQGYLEEIREICKVVDEADVHRLNLLRVALVNGGMLRRYRGAFQTTKRGRHLIEPGREGALFLALWSAYFLETNLGYTDFMPHDDLLQLSAQPIMFGLLSTEDAWITMDELRNLVLVTAGIWEAEGQYFGGVTGAVDFALHRRVLQPLADFGLIEIDASSHHPIADLRAVRATSLLSLFAGPREDVLEQLGAIAAMPESALIGGGTRAGAASDGMRATSGKATGQVPGASGGGHRSTAILHLLRDEIILSGDLDDGDAFSILEQGEFEVLECRAGELDVRDTRTGMLRRVAARLIVANEIPSGWTIVGALATDGEGSARLAEVHRVIAG